MQDKVMHRVLQMVISLACLSLLGPLSINIGAVVPVTLQTFFVILPAMLFGWQTGSVVVFLYLLAGSLGLPVFAGYTGGYEKLFGASAGYLLAFLFAALLSGWLRDKMNRITFGVHLLIWITAHIFIIAIGMMWQLHYTGSTLPDQLPLIKKFLIGAMLKSLAGATLSFYAHTSPRLRKLLAADQ